METGLNDQRYCSTGMHPTSTLKLRFAVFELFAITRISLVCTVAIATHLLVKANASKTSFVDDSVKDLGLHFIFMTLLPIRKLQAFVDPHDPNMDQAVAVRMRG
ncbi:hypothetical protein BCR37DRAFT_391652 [Protomyces lactucae-debilis]|uniref:Uncharacterized protein n=1 Tax=Protomyces lactucae-debilis TaxID=2754530 RepID=A0A1Y2FNX5_PROLT|nr:uncharacterized protein BCR37DRAFT_391652 [Protomyces lactucae-debilis]ORY84916.1 hypothetical protein BCR37DRAFT_391652 [Protomyces lactucae-debilis]